MRVYHLGFSGPFQLQPFCLFEASPITRWFSALICVLATCQLCPNFFVMQPEVRPKTSWPCDWQLWWVLMSENETFVRFPGFARVSRSTTFSGCFFEKTSSVLLLCVTELVWCIWEKLSLLRVHTQSWTFSDLCGFFGKKTSGCFVYSTLICIE